MGRRPQPPREPAFCSVEGCHRRAKNLVLVLCDAHYSRHKKHGDTFPDVPIKNKAVRFVHGTIRGYTDFSCRCDPCREANREAGRAAKAKRLSRPIPEHVHGTANGYSGYDCRCEDCCRVSRENYRAWRKKVKK